jgi:hypothetical protein
MFLVNGSAGQLAPYGLGNHLVPHPLLQGYKGICVVWRCPMLKRYPISAMLQDALVLSTPILLILIGVLFLG